ncbi:hypothetical protein Aduo_013694 [Ancylostoma duodenale]
MDTIYNNDDDTKDASITQNTGLPNQHLVYQACKMLGDRVEKFSGAGDRTFEEFLEDYTDLIARFSISHDVARCLLPLYLTGGAKLKLQTIPQHDKMSWKELVVELAKKFKSEAVLSNLRDELHNLTQGKDSVGEFAKKVYNKTKIAFQGQGENIVARMATDFFIKGLNPDIRKAIRRLPDTEDFDAVVSRAEKEFRILEQERKEDQDTIHAINALITDDKVTRLERQLNKMKIARRRSPAPFSIRPTNRPRMNNSGRSTPGNSRFNANFNSANTFFKTRKFGPRNNPFRSSRSRVHFAQQHGQPCGCCTHNHAPIGTVPNTHCTNTTPACQPPRSSTMMPVTTANLLCLVTFLALLSSSAAQYQICGSNIHGNTFSLPEATDCTVPPDAPMLRTTIQLYAEQSQLLSLNATKCYKDVLEVSITNFLYICTEQKILNRRRVSIPQGLCQSARITGKVHEHDLVQISPGLLSTNEIDEGNSTLPLWGTNKYTRSIYSLETGQVASFDGKSIISSLANLENCTLSKGSCITRNEIVVWEPVHSAPICRFTQVGSFEALVTMQHIVLPHSDVVLQFSHGYLLHAHLTEQCKTLATSYLTTSNHIVTFPYIPQDIMVHDYILRMAHRRKVRRATRYIKDKYGRTSTYQLTLPEPVPLIKRLFDTDVTNEIPNFRTRPIVKRKILQDMARWNVTNEDFNKIRRFYNITDPRLIALRTIRYAEYRTKQLYLFRKFEERRPLNYAELAVRRDLQQGISPIFDEYLNAEFGTASFNTPGALPKDWYLHVPFAERSEMSTTRPRKPTPQDFQPSTTTTTPSISYAAASSTSTPSRLSNSTTLFPTRPIVDRVWTILSPIKLPSTTPPIPKWMTATKSTTKSANQRPSILPYSKTSIFITTTAETPIPILTTTILQPLAIAVSHKSNQPR